MLKDQCVTIHDMVEVVITILDVRDPYTFEHSRRVAALAQRIAEKMGIPPKCLAGKLSWMRYKRLIFINQE